MSSEDMLTDDISTTLSLKLYSVSFVQDRLRQYVANIFTLAFYFNCELSFTMDSAISDKPGCKDEVCRLVMIDDNPLEHLIIQKLCQQSHYFHDAIHFFDARVTLEQIKRNLTHSGELPDVILLDLQMPEFNGWDFLQQFESLYRRIHKKVHVYVFTSSIDPSDRERSKHYPFVHDFISKPMRKEVLQMIYRRYVQAA